MQAFERLLTLLVAVTGLRIGEVLALRWKRVDWNKFRNSAKTCVIQTKCGRSDCGWAECRDPSLGVLGFAKDSAASG